MTFIRYSQEHCWPEYPIIADTVYWHGICVMSCPLWWCSVCFPRYTQSLMELLEFLDKSPDDHRVLETWVWQRKTKALVSHLSLPHLSIHPFIYSSIHPGSWRSWRTSGTATTRSSPPWHRGWSSTKTPSASRTPSPTTTSSTSWIASTPAASPSGCSSTSTVSAVACAC